MAAAVNSLLRDPDGRAAMARRAQRASKYYNWETVGAKLLQAYSSLGVAETDAGSVARRLEFSRTR